MSLLTVLVAFITTSSSNLKMTNNAYCTSYHAPFSNNCCSSYTCFCCNSCIFSNNNVMSYMNKIVNFYTIMNFSIEIVPLSIVVFSTYMITLSPIKTFPRWAIGLHFLFEASCITKAFRSNYNTRRNNTITPNLTSSLNRKHLTQ